MRVLQIGSDRSKQGVLVAGSPAYVRQQAYAKQFAALDIIGFSLRSDGFHAIADHELSVHPTSSFSKLMYAFGALRIARTLPRPDVVSVQDPFEVGLVGWIIARMLGVPLHVQIHTDFLSPAYARSSFFNRARVAIAGFVLPRAKGIRVVSERIKTSLQSYPFAVPISVLPIFVDVQLLGSIVHDATIDNRFRAFRMKLLVVSRLEPEKHIALAISSFAFGSSVDACLVIVGEGSERMHLQRLAKKLGITDRVFFEGTRNPLPYYALADLVLVPSSYDGYGMVIIEALAAGKPVLSTDVGIAREAGALVSPPGQFPENLKAWFANGSRTGELKSYPYKSFDQYVAAYCDDILATVR